MKKIVALVLCLVLALSLCTVAFAEAADEYAFADINATAAEKKDAIADAGRKIDTTEIAYVGAKPASATRGAAGNVAYVTIAAGEDFDGSYPVVAVADAKFQVLDAYGAVKYYLGAKVDNVAALTYDFTLTLYSNIGTKCGQLNGAADTKYYTYVDAAGDAQYVTTTTASTSTKNFMLDGKLVNTADAGELILHAVEGTRDATTKKITKLTCVDCGTSYDVVANAAVAGAKLASTVAVKANTAKVLTEELNTLYVAAPAAGSSTTVESAKTFDAGIALYAGMALASVAGSAVVIGKKKEF